MGERVRIEIEMKLPQGEGLNEIAALVLAQMQKSPGHLGPGTGLLNYIYLDPTMRITSAKIHHSGSEG